MYVEAGGLASETLHMHTEEEITRYVHSTMHFLRYLYLT